MRIRLKCDTCGWEAEGDQENLPRHPLELILPGDCHRIDALPVKMAKPE